LALAISVSTLVSDYIGTKHFELKKETIIDLVPYLIIFGIIGARLYYCIMDYNFYLRFPTEILALRHGGISIHGAILGGIIGIIIFAKKYKLSFLKLCDVSSIGLVLGQAIGRWGNFFNSEAYGLPTNLPWKLYIAPQYRQIPFLDVQFYHPAFLYESILDLIIFVILMYIVKTNKFKKEGNLALIYLILYSIARIIVETFRIDSVRYIFGIPIAIVVSVGIIVLSVILLFYNNKNKVMH
jgi:phosphatidylglycerol:prolipoprotein diacylglycerol transferase